MSSEQEQIRSLAERVARRLSESRPETGAEQQQQRGARSGAEDNQELTALRARLAEIQQRLAHVESHIAHDDSCDATPQHQASTPAAFERERSGSQRQPQPQSGGASGAGANRTGIPRLSGTYVPATHPSQEQFGIDEAVSELVDFFEREKMCSVEPGEKPCDHCGMCSSRGF